MLRTALCGPVYNHSFNPLSTNGFFLLGQYSILKMVFCIYRGVRGYNFQIKLFFFFFCLSKECRPWWNATSCSISSGSLLFAKEHIWTATWDIQQCGMCDQQSLRSTCASCGISSGSSLFAIEHIWAATWDFQQDKFDEFISPDEGLNERNM